MLQPNLLSNQFIHSNFNQPIKNNQNHLKIKKCQSKIIQESHKPIIDLNIQEGQTFKCFQCTNTQLSSLCITCNGTGYIQSNHAMALLMNDLFNHKFTNFQKQQDKKDLVSTKSSTSKSVSEIYSPSSHKNSSILRKTVNRSNQKGTKQSQRSSVWQFIRAPLQSIIKQESTYLDQKCQKCNICHFQFDSIKYTCEECENYNVCEQCYHKKRINHCHNLKKILSISSKKTSKHQQQEKQRFKTVSFNNERDQLYNDENNEDHSHSQVHKMSINSNSDEDDEILIGEQALGESVCGQDSYKFNKSNPFQDAPKLFFKLHEIAQQQQKIQKQDLLKNKQNQKQINMTVKYCQNCQNKIEDCYWICDTCQHQGQTYEICKECYDASVYQHQPSHNLGLNFFTLNSSFFQAQNNFLDNIKEVATQQADNCILRDSQLRNGLPISVKNTASSSTKISFKSQPDVLNIGLVEHRDIFKGFGKQTENEHYKDEIISPIPWSVNSFHPFRDKKSNELQDSFVIPELMTDSAKYSIKKFRQRQRVDDSQIIKQQIDQSRVYFDDNVMRDFSISTDYKDMKRGSNSKSQKKPITTNNLNNSSILNSSVSSIHHISQINPEKYLLEPGQDFMFNDYTCDICQICPIKNVKYHCKECQDYDLCEECYENKRLDHWHDHFRKDDGKQKCRRIKIKKDTQLRKVMQDQYSPKSCRRSVRIAR